MEIILYSKKDLSGSLVTGDVSTIASCIEVRLLNAEVKDCSRPTGTFELLGKHSSLLRTSCGT